MSFPIHRTKIIPPPLRETLVSRPRLVERLDGGKNKKLSLIAAPAGFGKTTLAQIWTQSLNGWGIAWLSLDYKDNDPKTFAAYLIAALSDAAPDLDFTSLLEAGSGIESYELVTLMTFLINLLSRSEKKLGLVLDDYHVIYTKEIHSALNFLVDHQPSQLHIIITSREQPDLPLHRLRVRNEMTEVNSRHLRFQEDEIALFLKKVMNTTVTSALIKLVAKQTEGWIAGLQMAALALNNPSQLTNLELRIKDFTGHHHYVLDYFGEEVLANLDESVRQFLFQTSILSNFSAGLCQAVTNRPDTEEILDYIQRANLFLIPLDENREWYRYHHLFADFLQGYLSDEAKMVLHRRASRWFAQNEMITEGIEHAIAAQDYKAAEKLIINTVEGLLKRGQINQVRQWIDALPDDRIGKNVYLLALRGWILHLSGDPEGAAEQGTLANTMLSTKTEPVHAAIFKIFKATRSNYQGDPSIGLTYAQEGLAALEAQPADRWEVRFFKPAGLSVQGESALLLGRPAEAYGHFLTGQQLAEADHNHLLTGETTANLLAEQIARGDRDEAETIGLQFIERYGPNQSEYPNLAGFGHIELGRAYFEANRLEEAVEHAESGVKQILQVEMHKYALSGYELLARCAFAKGDLDEADSHLRKGKQLADNLGHRGWIERFDLVEAEFSLNIGNLTAFEKWLAADSQKSIPHLTDEKELLTCRLLVIKKQTADASRQIISLDGKLAGKQREALRISANLLGFLNTGQAEYLSTAVRIGAPGSYFRRFLAEPVDWRSHLPTIKGIDPFFASQIEKGIPSDASADGEQPTSVSESPLSERELEILSLVSKGMSNKEIGQTLFLTTGTTKWYLNQIYQKLSVRNRSQAVDVARASGWIS
ncbi:MAG: LuxR C-terminal-related transcriptional regulator [Chloroflexota bacterium]